MKIQFTKEQPIVYPHALQSTRSCEEDLWSGCISENRIFDKLLRRL